MVKWKNKFSESMPIWGTLLGLLSLVLLVTVLLKGTTIEVLAPKGLIATEQRRLMIRAVLLLLEIAIPTLTFFYYTAWKYRESNHATYEPHPKHDASLVFSIWAFPTITMILLAVLMWPATHRLAPQKSLDSSNPPITIQVVALRWKWLFIYPEQKIATTNFIQLPVNTPIQFDITGDEVPMSSFWIPQLGGQLYAMTGHVNRLNIMAATPGDYSGSTAEINGSGFAGMKFTTRAGSMEDFNAWVVNAKRSPSVLTETEYKELLKPSENNKVTLYSRAGPEIYDTMLAKYSGSHSMNMEHE